MTIPVLIVAATVVGFVIRLEVRQLALAKDHEKLEKKTEKLEGTIEAQGERTTKLEQAHAVTANSLGKIEGGVSRIEEVLLRMAMGSSPQGGNQKNSKAG